MKANKAKLTCSLTGQTRQSSHKYIAKKAEQYGVSSEVFQQYYVAKQAYLEFKSELQNFGTEATLANKDMTEETAEAILKYNGKSQKTLSDFPKAPASSPASHEDTPEETEETQLAGV